MPFLLSAGVWALRGQHSHPQANGSSPRSQAPRSCHPWITGTPLGTEDPPRPGLKCWLSAEVTAMRTSGSAVGAAAATQWAEMTAQTTSSYGGCDPVPCRPGLARPPALRLLASS